MRYDLNGKRIWVAGHRGMVGGAVVRCLAKENCEIITAGREAVDLIKQKEVKDWITENKLDVIVIAAAKVGGIHANNTFPVDFLYENLMIETNILHAAHLANVERVLFLGSSCIYPKDADQPITENALLTAPLEETNQWYAIAKIAGIKLIDAYRKQYGRNWFSVMPTNLYGPNDNYDLETSHVMPALIRKFYEAKKNNNAVQIWGSGNPKREFLHVDDLADAIIFLLKMSEIQLKYFDEKNIGFINVGSGSELSIRELADKISKIAEFSGEIVYDPSMPDGTMRKLLNSSKIRELGWKPKISLEDGLRRTFKDYSNFREA